MWAAESNLTSHSPWPNHATGTTNVTVPQAGLAQGMYVRSYNDS